MRKKARDRERERERERERDGEPQNLVKEKKSDFCCKSETVTKTTNVDFPSSKGQGQPLVLEKKQKKHCTRNTGDVIKIKLFFC